MFEKPHLVSKFGSVRIQIAADVAQRLVADLKAASFDVQLSAEDITYTDLNTGVEENVATIEVPAEMKDAVRHFLRQHHR